MKSAQQGVWHVQMKKIFNVGLVALAFLATSCKSVEIPAAVPNEIDSILDMLHSAASDANGDVYFDLFHTDGIFLGTDATERWTVDEFKAYAKPFFDQGRGWTYTVTVRRLSFSPDGKTIWFDELLENDNLGQCRGSGVLLPENGEWKIAQYNLSIPIPNDLASDVVGKIRDASN